MVVAAVTLGAPIWQSDPRKSWHRSENGGGGVRWVVRGVTEG